MPDDLRAFAEYVDRIPSVAEHEASERAAHIYRHEAQAERERADAAERNADDTLRGLTWRWYALAACAALLFVVAWGLAFVVVNGG